MLTLALPFELVIVIGVGVVCAWLLSLGLGFVVAGRSGVLQSRGEAAERSDEEESFDLAVDEAVLLTHEALADEEESDEDVDHIGLWEAELRVRPGIARHMRRMERWSR